MIVTRTHILNLFKIAVAALVCLTVFSCSDNTSVMAELDLAESVMEEHPDSALALLDTLDRNRLVTREAKARHALLYSQALDKNYIDLTTDSIIRPAVRYYARHGSPDDRLKAQYYLGCIFRNAGDQEQAMEHFVEAEKYVDRATDWQAVGRLYSAKRTIYADIYDFGKSYRDALLSAEYYGRAGDLRLQVKALTFAADYAYILKEYEIADSLLNDIKGTFWDGMDDLSKSYYYSSAINLARHSDIDTAKKIIGDYLRDVSDPEDIDWGVVANAYRLAEDTDSALWALEHYPLGIPDYGTDPQYLLLSSLIYEDLEQYDKAYAYLKKYSDIVGDEDIDKFEADTKFIEERNAHEDTVVRHHNTVILIILGSVSALLLAAIIIIILRNRIRIAGLKAVLERQEAENRYANAMTRMQALELTYKELSSANDTMQKQYEAVLSELKSKTMDNNGLRNMIAGRMQTFFKILVSVIIYGKISGKSESEIKSVVENREMLLGYLRQYTSMTYPELESHLIAHGLTGREIDFCNLYLLGLRGNEIGRYLGLARHYTVSSGIRKKLGLGEHDANIDIYLRQLIDGLRQTR